MNQKRFANILLIVLIVVLVGAGAYFVATRQTTPTSVPTPTPSPIQQVPPAGPVTIKGKITCLPKKGSGPQTEECAIGLRGTDGRHYGLKNLSQHDPDYKFSVTGLNVEVSGILSPETIPAPAGNKYDVAGVIDVASIKKSETVFDTGTVQPEDPDRAGLAPYPDLPLVSLYQQPLSIKSVVEHRSALNGKNISIRGVIVSTLLGEKACPPDRGMCTQPSIFLADTTNKNRNTLYDLRVLVNEKEQEKSYPIGNIIDLQVIIDSSKIAIVALKTY